MKSKKRTQIAVLRHILGSYEGQEEVFAATVQRSVSWVKKASSGLRMITPKTARQVSLATGVSEKWLLAGDPNAPILERNDVTPYTLESYEGWRRDNLTASYSEQSESTLLGSGATPATVDPPLIAAIASEITKSLFAAYEAGNVNTAMNDLWKFSKVMKIRYGAPNELGLSVQFTRDVAVELATLSNIELQNMLSLNDR